MALHPSLNPHTFEVSFSEATAQDRARKNVHEFMRLAEQKGQSHKG